MQKLEDLLAVIVLGLPCQNLQRSQRNIVRKSNSIISGIGCACELCYSDKKDNIFLFGSSSALYRMFLQRFNSS